MPVVTTAQFVEVSRRVRQTVLDLASVEMGECANLYVSELSRRTRRGRTLA